MSAVLARENGIEIPVKRKSQPEEKPEPKKKKQLSWQSVKTLLRTVRIIEGKTA